MPSHLLRSSLSRHPARAALAALVLACLASCQVAPAASPSPAPTAFPTASPRRIPTSPPPSPVPATPWPSLLGPGTVWRYRAQTQAPDPDWASFDYDDQDWPTAQLPLGTERPVRTLVSPNPEMPTVYLRTAFESQSPALWRGLALVADFRHGLAAYLNGLPVVRVNLGADDGFSDRAASIHDTAPDVFDLTWALPQVRPGRNVLAVEVHQMDDNLELHLEASLHVVGLDEPPRLTYGPLLGRLGPDTVSLQAGSDIPAAGRLEYGPAGGEITALDLPAALTHTLTLNGLQPGATYTYRFGLLTSTGQTWSPAGRWITDGGPSQSFHFAVWADSRPRSGNAMPAVFGRLMSVLEQRGPLALGVAVGDNVELTGTPGDPRTVRDHYLAYLSALDPQARQMPFYAALGNHDDPGCEPCLSAFKSYFVLPQQNDKTYYSFDYGPAHFILLNTNEAGGSMVDRISDAQWAWLLDELEDRSRPVTLVFMHDPLFRNTANKMPYDTDEQERLHNLFRARGVTAVFHGDAHYYDFYQRDGVAYFITGGAGSPLYAQPHEPEWSQHEVLLVDVSPERILVEALLPDGTLLDQRTLPVLP